MSRVYKNIFRLDKIISEMCVANIPIKFIQIDTNYKNCTIILRIYIYINYQRLFIAFSLVIITTKLILIDSRFFFFQTIDNRRNIIRVK